MLLAKSHLYVRKLAFIQRLDLTSEQLTLTNISTRTRLFSRVSESRERTEERKEENNAIVEKSRVRTLLPPHYVKVHTRVKEKKKLVKRKKNDRRQNANRRERARRTRLALRTRWY